MNVSWSPSGCGPRSRCHVDPAGDEVGAAGQPRRPSVSSSASDPDVLVERVGLLGLDVGGAVLEAEQVARRGLRGRGGRRAAEAELRPAHRDRAEADAGQVADRVHGDLRVVGAGLHAQVAAGPGRVELVAREVRQVAQRRGRRSASRTGRCPRRRGTAPGPKPKVIVSPAGGSPIASPVSSGGRSARALDRRRPRRRRRPRVIRSAASVHACSSATSSSRESVVTSNAAKCSRSCAGVTMPAWCAPWKGYDDARRRRPAPPGRVVARGPCPTTKAPATPAAAAPPPRSPRLLSLRRVGFGQTSTAAVSWDSGSDSALTASESSLICSGVSSS